MIVENHFPAKSPLLDLLPQEYSNHEVKDFQQGEVLCQTHGRVNSVFILLSGTIEYYLEDEVTEEITPLISTSEIGMIVGWELLTPTNRFISNTRITSPTAQFVRISASDFLNEVSIPSLRDTCSKIYRLLQISIFKQINLLDISIKQRAAKLDDYYISHDAPLEERILLLRSSPFFGEMSEKQISSIAQKMERREYEANELIYEQDENPEGIFVLIQGEVSIRRQEKEAFLNLRSISTAGYIFGWSSMFDQHSICRASTEFKSSVYLIPRQSLIEAFEEEATLGIEFFKALIWLIGNQLQLSYSWYEHLLDNHSHISIKQLLSVNASRIPISSPLHSISHLLQNTATHYLAFKLLHELHASGTKQERHLSSISLDLLKGEEKEILFLEKVSDVYISVANGDPENHGENRKICAEKTQEVFDLINYQMEGMENLPDEGGNIFIYNHLVNHPRYTLNNHFQLTLDSHFISSMILHKKYNDPGMRTVRYGKSFEYGHQDYYENLGYLSVYTADSDLADSTAKEVARAKFYQEAEHILNEGQNLIISPEGTSFISEESPGPFKMGPFNLASQAKKEPKIVPIVFYNFDKRISETLLYCKVLPAFRLSEKKKNEHSLKQFVNEYQQEFAREVRKVAEKTELLFHKMNQ